jgi:hypothetical protein
MPAAGYGQHVRAQLWRHPADRGCEQLKPHPVPRGLCKVYEQLKRTQLQLHPVRDVRIAPSLLTHQGTQQSSQGQNHSKIHF